jgi:DNA modification methylase
MKIEKRKIADLSQDPANVRKHPERNLEAIIASLRRFGQQHPIVIDINNTVRAGNGRLQAAIALGWDEIDCVVTDLKGSEAIAYAIADNRTAELAEWDDDMLAAQLHGLLTDDEALLEAAGFDEDELAAMLDELEGDGTTGEIVEDEVPEPPADPITKPGDLWILGRHRVLCGDSTKAEDVARLLSDQVPFIMVTDPPYGVEYDSDWRLQAGINKPWQTLASGKVENDDKADWTETYKLFPGHVAYVWHAGRFAATLVGNLNAAGLEIRTQIIWSKPSLVMGRGHYHWQHEPCWYAVRKGGSAKWCGDRKQSTIWQIANMHRTQGNVDDGKTIHSTQKPVECMARPIRNHGEKDDDVYDPFLGSGTTLIAAEQLGRKCYGMEISPQYCDVIVKRWENLTGEKAVCQSATPA